MKIDEKSRQEKNQCRQGVQDNTEKDQERSNCAAAKESSSDSKIETLFHGDFREESKKIPDGSVDLIFTDPLYYTKDILLYKDLGDRF